jgi:drug/metabolite transporter (DMT)-like permease
VPSTSKVYFILSAGLLAVSLAAIFIRFADAPGLIVATYRMLLASLLLALISFKDIDFKQLNPKNLAYAVSAGAFLAIHFASWISSLSFTSIAASVSLVASQPLWVVLFAWFFLALTPNTMTFVGISIAILGGGIISFGDFSSGSAPLLGNSLALLGAISMAAYLLLGKTAQNSGLNLQTYIALTYGSASLFLLPLPFFFSLPYFSYSASSFFWILLLALIPQLIGHTSINYAMKYLAPTLVATAVLLEPVGASLFAILLFQELPGFTTLIGALLLLTGVFVTLRSSQTLKS